MHEPKGLFEVGQPLLVYYRNWHHLGRVFAYSDLLLGLSPLFTASSVALPDKPHFSLRQFYEREFDLVNDFTWEPRPSPAYLGIVHIVEAVSFPEKEFDAIERKKA